MTMVKFLHMADTHLGYKQYNLHSRYTDFLHAFEFILQKAVEERVDFVLIAGDMFNDSKVNPETLSKVYQLLTTFHHTAKMMVKKDIPILAIEGNHDSPIFSAQSWMKFLADLGLIQLLSGSYTSASKEVSFVPHSLETNRGGYFEVGGVRIYGLPYYGSNTPLLFPAIYEALPEPSDQFTILMMHFGIAGKDKKKPGIAYSKDLKRLHEKVNYLALGHFHTMYTFPAEDEWIYNPGSIEVNDIKEYDINKDHGAFLIEMNSKDPNSYKVTKILCENGDSHSKNTIPNRTFYSPAPFDVGNSKPASFKDTIADILKNLTIFGFNSRKAEETPENKRDLNYPILVLTLFGTVPYSRLEFNTRLLRETILQKLDILDARIYSAAVQSELDGITLEGDEELSIEEIEKKVFSMMIDSNIHYRPVRSELVNLVFDIKAQLQENDVDPKALKNHIKDWYGAHIAVLNIEKTRKSAKEKLKAKSQTKKNHPDGEKPKPQSTEDEDMGDLLGDITDYEDSGDDDFDFEV